MSVLDLGSAPGGWSQLAGEIVGDTGRVVATDILSMDALPDVVFVQGDFTEQDLHVWLFAHELAQGCCDVAACDQSRCDLIKQRLEQIEVAFVDQGDSHLGLS